MREKPPIDVARSDAQVLKENTVGVDHAHHGFEHGDQEFV